MFFLRHLVLVYCVKIRCRWKDVEIIGVYFFIYFFLIISTSSFWLLVGRIHGDPHIMIPCVRRVCDCVHAPVQSLICMCVHESCRGVRCVCVGVFSFFFYLIPRLWNPALWTSSLFASGLRKSSRKVWTARVIQVCGSVVMRSLIFGNSWVPCEVLVGGRAIRRLHCQTSICIISITLQQDTKTVKLRCPHPFVRWCI